MNRKVGDKVKIKEDLIEGKFYGELSFLQGMTRYKGKEVTIANNTNEYYELKEISFGWTDEMLEDIIEEESYCYNLNCQYINNNSCDINSINTCKACIDKESINNVALNNKDNYYKQLESKLLEYEDTITRQKEQIEELETKIKTQKLLMELKDRDLLENSKTITSQYNEVNELRQVIKNLARWI